MKTPKPEQFVSSAGALILYVLLLLSISAVAQENHSKSESPYFFVISNDPANDQLPLKSTKASVSLAGVIADVAITQEYRNEGQHPLEAIYTFPASTNAAVYGMEMLVGDRRIEAKIEEKDQARTQYEAAKSEFLEIVDKNFQE